MAAPGAEGGAQRRPALWQAAPAYLLRWHTSVKGAARKRGTAVALLCSFPIGLTRAAERQEHFENSPHLVVRGEGCGGQLLELQLLRRAQRRQARFVRCAGEVRAWGVARDGERGMATAAGFAAAQRLCCRASGVGGWGEFAHQARAPAPL